MPHTMLAIQFLLNIAAGNCIQPSSWLLNKQWLHQQTQFECILHSYTELTMTLCTCTHLQKATRFFFNSTISNYDWEQYYHPKNCGLVYTVQIANHNSLCQCKCNVALYVTSFEILINLFQKEYSLTI